MRFKTKDLLVTVFPNQEITDELKAKLCIWGTRICVRPSLCRWPSWWCHRCTFLFTLIGCRFQNSCGVGGSACDPTQIPCGDSIWFIEDPRDLVTLKEELNDVLKQVDRLQEKGLPLELSSRSDLDAAEEALEGALNEVRRQRKQQ